MTENKAIERIKYRMHTVEQVAGENGMEDLEMAIKHWKRFSAGIRQLLIPTSKMSLQTVRRRFV